MHLHAMHLIDLIGDRLNNDYYRINLRTFTCEPTYVTYAQML